MAVDVLLGLQWGDEGKGKIVDYLAGKYDVVARFQGGPNAGHTLEFDGIKHVLHQVPSGVFHPHIINIIGNGVVLDAVIFQDEAEKLLKYDIELTKNVYISKKTQLILPSHRALDAAYEASKGKNKIGSTLKGIGPTYQDKIGRSGLRVGDILSDDFQAKYDALVAKHREILGFYNYEEDFSEREKEFFASVEFLKKFKLVDSEVLINQYIREGKTILAEGAQGSLLDIDYGTYPFVTSSNTTVAGACTGLGIAPKNIGRVLGIVKAYCTRVGGGPFPTELFDQDGENLGVVGREFGATTGRKRRCGWIDLPAIKYVNDLNGTSELMMMKTDVLDGFETIKVCTAYKLKNGEVTETLPYDLEDIESPIYEEVQGWNCSLENVKSYEEFPQEVKDYVSYLEDKLSTPISVVSIGPDRTQTIMR
ncbi:MAG: adenylosuccinate synthase [Cytophagales bacterium]|nr:adenylosuccinate synthase [Cytophagales bacterium]